jgi:hypothetical protein
MKAIKALLNLKEAQLRIYITIKKEIFKTLDKQIKGQEKELANIN